MEEGDETQWEGSDRGHSVGQRPVFALLIGIDEYRDRSITDLKGAITDCQNMENFLKNLNVNIERLYNNQATREGITNAIRDLSNDGRIRNGDPILIYYAGHGGEISPPPAWNLHATSKIQMLLPHDFIYHSPVSSGLFDRTLSDLLATLSNDKGDNIVVILDTCHSGSGTRHSTLDEDPTSLVRGVELPSNYAVDALHEQDFLGSNGNSRGYRSIPTTHVLLAACREEQSARETERGGRFTCALIETLERMLKNNNFDTITYKDLIHRLPNIERQNPQCEGTNENRFFFNGKCAGNRKQFYGLTMESPGSYLLQAGQVHGIGVNAEFAVYADRNINLLGVPSRGTLVVEKVGVNTSKLRQKTLGRSFDIPKPAFGVETRKGNQERLRVAVSDEGIKTELLAQRLRGVMLVNEDDGADLLLIQGASDVEFKILRQQIVNFGLTHTQSWPKSPDIQDLINLLDDAADFHFHLDRSPEGESNSSRLASQIKVVFVPVTARYEGGLIFYFPQQANGRDREIDGGRPVHVSAGTAQYGIKITNHGHQPVYLSVFYFNQSTFRIDRLHNPPTAANGNTCPCLSPNESMKMGYDHRGENAFRFDIQNAKQQIDVGFLKIFLSTSYVDLSGIAQGSPVDEVKDRSHKQRDMVRSNNSLSHGPSEFVWDTLTTTIIQHRS